MLRVSGLTHARHGIRSTLRNRPLKPATRTGAMRRKLPSKMVTGEAFFQSTDLDQIAWLQRNDLNKHVRETLVVEGIDPMPSVHDVEMVTTR